jgi:hypothetical protein
MLGEWRHPRIAHHHARVEILLLGNGNANGQENEGQLHFYSYEHQILKFVIIRSAYG